MFREKTLRVLFDPPLSGFENMSRDEVLWEGLARSETVVLRFFRWQEETLSVGRFQKTEGINREYLKSHNIPLVRRPTGGRAILHGEEVTLSLALPGNPLSPRQAYREFKSVLQEALKGLGIPVDQEIMNIPLYLASPACFSLTFPHELTVGGKKIAGIAQARGRGGSLFQVSLPFRIDRERFASCFREKEVVLQELEKNFLSLTEMGFGVEWRIEIEQAIIESFGKWWGVVVKKDNWKEEEEERNQAILREKYLLSSYHEER
ncbi:MAG: lipoate--protein ligase family protein [Atribacterota bacterium]